MMRKFPSMLLKVNCSTSIPQEIQLKEKDRIRSLLSGRCFGVTVQEHAALITAGANGTSSGGL